MFKLKNNPVIIFSPLALSGIFFCSCAFISPADNLSEEQREAILTLDLFAGRGFAGGAEYERYHVENEVLWRECGTIERKDGKKSAQKTASSTESKSNSEPKLIVENSGVVNLSNDDLSRVKVAFDELSEIFNKPVTLPEPGPHYSMIQPGRFEIKGNFLNQETKFSTSLDAVANVTPPELSAANTLFTLLRSIGEPNTCTNRSFFGISRK